MPESIYHIGKLVFEACDALLTTVKYKMDDRGRYTLNDDEVNRWLTQQHVHFPFHQAFSSTSATPQGIGGCFEEHGIELATEVDDQQLTVLRILCANPHITGDGIRAYLTLASEAANEQDSTGTTGLHILCSLPHQDTSTGDAIRAYLKLVPEAPVNVQDSDGMTPFQHICRSDVSLFIDERSFSSVMMWW